MNPQMNETNSPRLGYDASGRVRWMSGEGNTLVIPEPTIPGAVVAYFVNMTTGWNVSVSDDEAMEFSIVN